MSSGMRGCGCTDHGGKDRSCVSMRPRPPHPAKASRLFAFTLEASSWRLSGASRRRRSADPGKTFHERAEEVQAGPGRALGGTWCAAGGAREEPEVAAWVPPVGAGSVGGRGREGARRAERCCSGRVEGGALQAGPWLSVNAAGAEPPQLRIPLPESAPFAVAVQTHDFARARAKGREASKQDVLTTARARVPGATVGPGVGSRLLRAAPTFPVFSRRPAPTLMCRDEPDTMILTRKMDLCRVVGLVCLGSAAEGTGRKEDLSPRPAKSVL